jgi:hypothetical protein
VPVAPGHSSPRPRARSLTGTLQAGPRRADSKWPVRGTVGLEWDAQGTAGRNQGDPSRDAVVTLIREERLFVVSRGKEDRRPRMV